MNVFFAKHSGALHSGQRDLLKKYRCLFRQQGLLLIIEFLVLLHFIVQCFPVDVQQFGGLALIEVYLFQCLQDHFIFRIDGSSLQSVVSEWELEASAKSGIDISAITGSSSSSSVVAPAVFQTAAC
jgi:hypothetical protein